VDLIKPTNNSSAQTAPAPKLELVDPLQEQGEMDI
jgi:hypothetical protein